MPRNSARDRGYTSRWEAARAAFLRSRRYCAECARQDREVEATHVDHIRPHRGDQRLFWDKLNWQPLCQEHHNRDKQQIERRGYASRLGADGLPTDPDHPFNRRGGVESRHPKGSGPDRILRAELVSVIAVATVIIDLNAMIAWSVG